ncbi:Crp/Fnr family transcriptional regulator [Aminipila terrae]|uniref:Cyclic nucleotide-binding domain-containing protein n=1 Tax=Aminipila terrae TaxID=2697030 RepID=A0A6P1MI10_9FIRM|nr:Crp/Fnr family transcriptional regulator [Aminipila terrae]QHI73371.1 cyclic nucleotide-binding domain-containing protein [Aminipila terrae]
MKKYLYILKNNPLFARIDENDLESMLVCLSATVKDYSKNEIILMAGDKISKVGIVVEGSVQIVKEDILGNRNIIAQIDTGQIFAEAFSCAVTEKLPVSVIASANCTVMFIDYKRIIYTCNNSCIFHHKLLENMLGILARKNILLNNKIEHISKRTTREKALSFLFSQAQQQEKRAFRIPFNRQELADYLCVDRSALSNELSKLREEGIIEFNRNEFQLLIDEFN